MQLQQTANTVKIHQQACIVCFREPNCLCGWTVGAHICLFDPV